MHKLLTFVATALLVGVFAAIMTAVAAYVVIDTRTHDAIGKHEERMRERGEPHTLDELDRYYPHIDDEKNAALLYVKASNLLLEADPDDTRLDAIEDELEAWKSGDAMPQGLESRVRDFLALHDRVWPVLDEARTRPDARYPVDLSASHDEALPHLDQIRRCVRVLSAKSAMAAIAGDAQALVDCQVAMVHAADSLRMEPVSRSQLHRCWIIQIAAGSLVRRDLPQVALSDRQMAQLAQLYSGIELTEPLKRALIGERCNHAVAAGTIARGDEPPLSNAEAESDTDAFDSFPFTPFFARYQKREFYDHFGELLKASNLEWPSRLDAAEALMARVEGGGWRAMVLWFATDIQVYLFKASALTAAKVEIVRSILAIERYRGKHGRIPETLEDLVPVFLANVPIDPFDGQPIRYGPSNDSYIVYSVHINAVDNGGAAFDSDTNTGDFVVKMRWSNPAAGMTDT